MKPQPLQPDTPPVLLADVVKNFGQLHALDHVSFRVTAGETFGLIGPNGSGKTTLIRLLLGLSKPTSGTVHVLGHDMPNQKVAQRIGYMTQASALYGDLSIRENLVFFGRLYGLHGKLLGQRMDEVLTLVELRDRTRATVATLSGGMRQRVSLACALIHRPSLLFLDEPTVGIDPELRLAFWNYFRELNAAGVTILVSTHHLDEAARCHRLALLRFGHMLAVDTPEAIRLASGAEDFEKAFLYFARQREMPIQA